MIVKRGPSIYRVNEVSDVPITGTGGIIEGVFRWPRSVFCTGFLVMPATGMRSDLANLQIRIQDATFQDLVADGAGGHFAPLLGLCGTTPLPDAFSDLILARPFKTQWPVMSGDPWIFSIMNDSVAPDPLLVELLLYFEEGERA